MKIASFPLCLRAFSIAAVLLLAACVHFEVEQGTKLVDLDTKVQELAVLYETPNFDGYGTAATFATQHWDQLRPLLKEQTPAVMAQFGVRAHVYDMPVQNERLRVSEPVVLVVDISRATYNRALYVFLNLTLEDSRTHKPLWHSAATFGGGFNDKYDSEFAAKFVQEIGANLSKAGLIGQMGSAGSAEAPEASASHRS
jgi:hypothetical protein